MDGRLRYRVSGVVGTAALALLAVSIAEIAAVQAMFSQLPIIGHLSFDATGTNDYRIESATVAIVLIGALAPLYKPQTRRISNIIVQALRRLVVALLALATIGYFDFSFRLPRPKLIVAGVVLLVTVPAWFVLIRRRPQDNSNRTIIIGDDPESMQDIIKAVDTTVLGYVSPPSAYAGRNIPQIAVSELTDGGVVQDIAGLPCLGGLSRLDEILIEHDVGTAVLAFARPDRGEFFGALDSCYKHGVSAKVHRDHANAVLTKDSPHDKIVEIELEPWDWQEYVAKRIFDIAFATTALLVLLPVIILIALAIRLEGNGPILFAQQRTYLFGETFTVHKFRTLKPDPGNEVGTTFDYDRQTPLGEFLRTTHLDEIPQLYAILIGNMSVVGPRPAQTKIEDELESEATQWRQRWFVKPGLTGLAQINAAHSQDPETKLHYDLKYIRKQSFWYDLKIIGEQFRQVGSDLLTHRDEQ